MSGCVEGFEEPVYFRSVSGPGEYRGAVEELVDAVGTGPLEGRDVLVKPNQLTRTERGVTTDPGVLDAVLAEVSEAADSAAVGESDTSGRSFEYAVSGLDVDHPLLNTSEEEATVFEGVHGSLEVPVPVLERAVVDVPVLKTHSLSGVTAAVKNLFGLLPVREMGRLHHRLDDVLCDLYRAASPELCVLDGTHVMRSGGPRSGEVAWGGFLAASGDPLALDVAACAACGVEVGEVPHLRHMAGDRVPELRGELPDLELDPPSVGARQRIYSFVQRFDVGRRVLDAADDML